jgi:GNAT superfamily N-acetyltransferase
MAPDDLPVPPVVTLAPMTTVQYQAWRTRSVREYAEGHVEAGNWPAAGSVDRAAEAFRALLPDGLDTPGHHLWSIREAGGRQVGVLWVGPRQPSLPGALFIWDIAIEPGHRGQGLGRGALDALDAWARTEGYERIGLHVFGSNETARRLYRRAGYIETDVLMEKRL